MPALRIIMSGQLSEGFSHFQLFWMSGNEDPIAFYIKNLGILAFLIAISVYKAPKSLLKNYLPFLVIFVITNIYIFQPHDFDNMKIMLYWLAVSLILVSYYIESLWNKRTIFKVMMPIIIFFTIITGILSLIHESYDIHKLYDKEGISLAEKAKNISGPNEVFLTSTKHNHPITSLSSRQIVMGYRGWLLTWGYNYKERERDVTEIYKGSIKTPSLIKKYDISYIVIGPSEKALFEANTEYFERNYKLIIEENEYKIFDVRT